MAVPPNGFGSKLNAMYEFHRERGLEARQGRGQRRGNQDFVRWCFNRQSDAENFAKTFGSNMNMRRFLILVASLSVVASFSSTWALAGTARIPLAQITTALENCFRGTRLYLNNYSETSGYQLTPYLMNNSVTYYYRDGKYLSKNSAISFSGCLGGDKVSFEVMGLGYYSPIANIPVVRAYGMNVYDLMYNIDASFYLERAVFSVRRVIPFENGFLIEFWGDRLFKIRSVCQYCVGAQPSLDLSASNSVIRIHVFPEVLNRDITYGQAHGTMKVNVSPSVPPPPSMFQAAAEWTIASASQQIQGAFANVIATTLANALMEPQRRNAVTALFRPILANMRITKPLAAYVTSDAFVIEY